MGKVVNKKQLSEILGKSERSLTQWQKNGMPIQFAGKRGQQNKYDTEQVIKWMLGQEAGNSADSYNLDEERARLAHNQANKTELEVCVLRGDLLDAGQVKKAWADIIIAFRAKILSIPQKISPSIARISDVTEVEEEIKINLHEALMEISNQS